MTLYSASYATQWGEVQRQSCFINITVILLLILDLQLDLVPRPILGPNALTNVRLWSLDLTT